MKSFTIRIVLTLSVLLSLQLSVSLECGWCMTQRETAQSITIPINQWNELKNECQALNSELMQCQTDLKKLKKPSSELVSELAEAQAMLLKLTKELEEQKADLTTLSNEAKESKALLQTLKEQINKERKVHRRQIWQNRLWCILIGAGIGYAASR